MDLIKAIVDPISPKDIAGSPSSEDECRDYLDDEFMKMGTLQHGDLDWAELENKAIYLLSERYKDFKVLSYLMLCLQQGGNPDRFLISLQILADFSAKYWTKGHPNPGKKGHALKYKLVTLMLSRSIESSKHLKLLLPDTPLIPQYKAVAKKLDKLIIKHKLKVIELDSIIKKITDSLAELETPEEKEPEENPANKSVAKKPAAMSSISSGVDFSSERKVKETYLKLAQFTNETYAENPLGYQLRRFGLWQSINAAPPKGRKGNTEMMAVLSDRVLEYSDMIKSQASLELLMRIEHTVETSPFWIQGNYLAASCAEKLGMSSVSEIILEATRGFLEKVPSIAENNFSDGTPFIDKKTALWVKSKQEQATNTAVADDFSNLYASEGLEATLNEINKQLESVSEQRDICHLKLLAAEFLYKSGIDYLAQSHLTALQEETKNMLVHDWEPSFSQRLSTLNNGGL